MVRRHDDQQIAGGRSADARWGDGTPRQAERPRGHLRLADGVLTQWVHREAAELQCGDRIWHGQVRTVTAICDVSNQFGHVLRFDLDSGEQLHRYPTDLIQVGYVRD